MAVLGRVLVSSAERLDLTDLLSIDSYTAGDFKYLIKTMAGDTIPYVLKGFEVVDPSDAWGKSSCSISVADSVVYFPASKAGSFFYGLPAGNTLAAPLVVKLKTGSASVHVTNYVYLTFTTTDTAQDSRAYWDPDQNGGAGGEFTKIVNTEEVLVVAAGASVSLFPDGTIPIAKITTDATGIVSIEDCRDMFFRLGTGGASPNPYNRFTFKSYPSAPYARREPATLMNNLTDPTPFEGGDKNIYTLKEWMDVVMTKLAELSGTPYWYQEATVTSVASLFQDTIGSTIKSKGTWSHTSIGKVSWSEDIVLSSIRDQRDVYFRAPASPITLLDQQIAFIKLIRGADINTGPVAVQWTAGAPYATTASGVIGDFANLSLGDWIKKKVDDDSLYLRVDAFYSGLLIDETPDYTTGGSTPANAKAILLGSTGGSTGYYGGISGIAPAIYTKGSYPSSAVVVAGRGDAQLTAAGGDLFWLAARFDTKVGITGAANGINHTSLTGIRCISNDNNTIQFGYTGHGLIGGDRVYIAGGASGPTGIYQVEVESTNAFSINAPGLTGATGAAFTADYALVTTTARKTGPTGQYGYVLENADHGLEDNDSVIIAGTTYHNSGTTGLDASWQVKVHSPTTFQIAATGASETLAAGVGTVSCVNVEVRKPFGAIKILQNESIDIGEIDGSNIQQFIGMTSLTQTTPAYAVPSGYGSVQGAENFNASAADDLTTRVSKLTAMMADRVQDRGTKITGSVTFKNTTSGLNQIVVTNAPVYGYSGSSNTTITIVRPNSGTSHTVDLSSSVTLPVMSAAYVTLDRSTTATAALTPVVTSISDAALLSENKFILFYRTTGSSVFTWDGHGIHVDGGSYTVGRIEHSQNKNITMYYPGNLNVVALGATGQTNQDKVSFSDTVNNLIITVPGSGSFNGGTGASNQIVNTSTINAVLGGATLPDGSSIWVRIDRTATKTFTQYSTTDNSIVDTNNSTGYVYITPTNLVPVDQDVVVLYQRVGSAVLTPHQPPSAVSNTYDETYVLPGASATGTSITLPLDSRDNNNAQYYTVGAGKLQLFLNGQYLVSGVDWSEVGATGSPSTSVLINQPLVLGDKISFRDNSGGGMYFYGPTGPVTLGTAYTGGKTITVTNGNPVTIIGAGTTFLEVDGGVNVTGAPLNLSGVGAGIQFTPQGTTPILGTTGLWVSTSGALMYQTGATSTAVSTTGAIAAIGGAISGGTSGSVLYLNASSQLAQDNANFIWDATNHRLGIGTTAPLSTLHVAGIIDSSGTGTSQVASFSNLRFNAWDNQNGYIQSAIQNLNNGATASSDWVATNDAGTDTTNFINMGINGSGYTGGTPWTISGPNDGYLFATGNLTLGTSGAAKNLIFHTGGTTAANVRMTIDGTTGFVGINTGLTTANSTLQVIGSASFGITGPATTGYTCGINDSTVLVNGATTINLPTAVGVTGRIYRIKNIASGILTVAATNSQKVDGGAANGSVTSAGPTGCIQVQSDGANWWVIAKI